MSSVSPFDELDPYSAPKADLTRPRLGGPMTEGIDLANENPFLTIWTRPRATIRGILDTNPTYMVIPLAMIEGVLQTLSRATQRNTGDQMPLAGILAMALVGGPIGGVIGLYIGGALMGWAGRLIGGRGEGAEVRTAIAWSQVPVVATIPIWLLQLAMLGHEMFTSQTPTLEANPSLGLFLMGTGVVEVILGVWAIVLALKCIGEAHRFSAWKALGAGMLLFLIIFVPLILLVVLVANFAR